MSKLSYSRSALSGLVESDSDDTHYEEQSTLISDTATENMAMPKKGGRPKAAPAAAKAPKAKKPPAKKGSRPTMKKKSNAQSTASDTEEVDDFEEPEDATVNETMISVDELDEPDEPKIPAPKPSKSSRATKAKDAAPAKPSKKAKASTNDDDAPAAPRHGSKAFAAPKKQGPRKRQRQESEASDAEIQETQQQAMEVDHHEEEVEEPTPKPAKRRATKARSSSHIRQPPLPRQHRAGSASDTERHDPLLRRKVGDLTRKLESMEFTYRNLRELGIVEAERNFEKQRKQSEESKKAANDVIASLRRELATQNTRAKDSQALKSRLEAQDTEIAKLQAKVVELNSSISESETENQAIANLLQKARAAAATAEGNAKAAANAAKSYGSSRPMGNSEAAQVAQLKEDLYADLTGLIIRGIKREEEEDIFDCIQTGRNGTLHFKFAVGNDKSVEGDEEPQCQYIPQLDPSRDKELKELLPDYLTDEIVFPRVQVERFYSRVIHALTEKQT